MTVAGCRFRYAGNGRTDVPVTSTTDSGPFVLVVDDGLRCLWSAGRPVGVFADHPVHIGRSVLPPGAHRSGDGPVHAALVAALDGHPILVRSRCADAELQNWVLPRPGSGAVLVSVDVTGIRSASVREQRAEERLRRLVEYSPALIGIRDAGDRLVHANQAFVATFPAGPDAPPDPVDGHPEADDTAELAGIRRAVARSRQPRVWDGRVWRTDGPVHLLGHVFPLPLGDGTEGVGEVLLDLSPQDQARRELAASDQRYRAIFDGAEICIILVDLDGRIVDANAASKRLTGRSRSELRGRFIGAVTTRADTEAHLPLWNELRAGRRSRYDRPMTLRPADGSLHPARCTMTLIRDETGRPGGGLGLAMPVVPDADPVPAAGDLRLSGPQAAVLERLAAGRGIREIASELGLSRRGVDYRTAQLRRTLRMPGAAGVAATAAELVARAFALGVLDTATWPPAVVRARPTDGDPG